MITDYYTTITNKKMISFSKKPTENVPDKQLFSFDVHKSGAKNFIYESYENIYQIIKSNNSPKYFNEDNTYANGIKLFIDYDEVKLFTHQIWKDKYADKIINEITTEMNDKIFKTFNIVNTPTIILMSDTLNKLSLHFIYPNIIFNNIHEMKFFMLDMKLIDQNVYKIGCFRMMYCSKFLKRNQLLFHTSFNYNVPNDDYKLFLDSSICYTNNKPHVNFIIPELEQVKQIKNLNPINYINHQRNYVYKNIDLNIIQEAFDKLKNKANNYMDWFMITLCIKDLYLGSKTDKQNLIYELYDTFCKQLKNYNKNKNKKIFMYVNPRIDINYLFKMAEMKHYILPFYDYENIIFNPTNYENVIIKEELYIDVSEKDLLKHNYIFIKSPPGTGKTTMLSKLIKASKVNNIISITSRVNLAGEHVKNLGLNFYQTLDYYDFYKCDKLVVQLESLVRCNYKLFKNGIVILDEINSLLSHLRSPTMDKRRRDAYMLLIELIKNAKYVISMDADLSNWNIKFIQEIKNSSSIIYYNKIKNKTNNDLIVYNSSQVMINLMEKQIKDNKYFIASFDSLSKMEKIIEHLSKSGNKSEWLIYSSKVDYGLIDTNTWVNKFVFYTPSIIYGIDYSNQLVDVFSFVHKNHLNPQQIYQMMSRARKQSMVHLYCKSYQGYIKYKSVDAVIMETEQYEKNFGNILPNSEDFRDVDERPYRIMYYNYIYMDTMLKTNIKGYLLDIVKNRGYNIKYNKTELRDLIKYGERTKEEVKDKVIELLGLNKENLTDFQKELASNDKSLEKHFNLRIIIKNNIEDRLFESISKNLFTETIKNKFAKIKVCKDIMSILEIDDLTKMTKDITANFKKEIKSEWLNENINIIKKMFNFHNKETDYSNYYKVYLLLIIILKNLFDNNLFVNKVIQVNNVRYTYYVFNQVIYNKHSEIFKKIKNEDLFID